MAISVFDLFKIGVGPSSSHTVGPMIASGRFVAALEDEGLLKSVASARVELFGSLGATGHGHGSVPAVVLGLMGRHPETVDPSLTPGILDEVRQTQTIRLADKHRVPFDIDEDVVLHRKKRLEYHSNAMTCMAYDENGDEVLSRTYYSIGGGFVVDHEATAATGDLAVVPDETPVPYPFTTGDELLEIAERTGLRISDIVMANECTWRTEEEVRAGVLRIWAAMRECVDNGMKNTGVLPGGLKVPRRAHALKEKLTESGRVGDELDSMDWVTLYALAVNEENAAGGRVVTAPTNGAAGIVPAVMHYYWNFIDGADEDGIVRFFLVATGIGILFKENASISGAEVGCQGEVGSACSMAAGGLAEVIGCSPRQVENAAEIGIEHNLGLTCDPVGGLVQIPCIERNAVASVKAITAARMSRHGDGTHIVSLDKAIKTMRETGADMKDKYKETARGGLALNVVEC